MTTDLDPAALEAAKKAVWDHEQADIEDIAEVAIRAYLAASSAAPVQGAAWLDGENEKICDATAMRQWEASLRRPDLAEKDRVRGAIEAFKRQTIALQMRSALLPAGDAKAGAVEGQANWKNPAPDASAARAPTGGFTATVSAAPHPHPPAEDVAKIEAALLKLSKVGFGYDLNPHDKWALKQAAAALASQAEKLASVERERDRYRFSPQGDNHHNALKCPYCNPSLIDWQSCAETASARIAVLEKALEPPSAFVLWFFREISDEQRLSLFKLLGYPVDEIGKVHGHQRKVLRRFFRELASPSPGADSEPTSPGGRT